MPSSTAAARLPQATIAGLVTPIPASATARGTPASFLDTTSLRQLFRQTLDTPCPPWARALGWQALLNTLPRDKAQWPKAFAKQRTEYYQFVQDVLPLADATAPASSGAAGAPLSERDMLLNSILNDIQAPRRSGGLFLNESIPPSCSNPLSPPPSGSSTSIEPRTSKRWLLLDRLAKINPAFRAALDPVQLSPGVSVQEAGQERYGDVWWHALLRILYVFSYLNPSIGYVQGMHDVASVFIAVFSQESGDGQDDTPNEVKQLKLSEHVEADAFWCFSALMGEVQELFDFDGVDPVTAGLHISNTRDEQPSTSNSHRGMAGALRQVSVRLKWLDSDLWNVLQALSLDPKLPTYAFRWLIGLLSAVLAPLKVSVLWDHLLTETGTHDPACIDGMSKIDFAIDVSCAMLVALHDPLVQAARPRSEDDGQRKSPYHRCMKLLLHYPSDIGADTVLSLAHSYRQRRLTSSLTGDGPDPVTLPTEKKSQTLLGQLSLSTSSWLKSSLTGPSDDTTSDEETLSSPLSGSLSHYAQQLSRSEAASQVSRQGTVWAAKALQSWNQAAAAMAMPTSRSPATVDNFALRSDDSHSTAYVTRNGTLKPRPPELNSDRSQSSGTPIGSPSSVASDTLVERSRVQGGRRSLILGDRGSTSLSHQAARLHERGSTPASDDSAPSAMESIAAVWSKQKGTPSTTQVSPKPLMLASHSGQHRSRPSSTAAGGRHSLGTSPGHTRMECSSTNGSFTLRRRDSLGSTVTSSSRASERRIRRGVGYVSGHSTPASPPSDLTRDRRLSMGSTASTSARIPRTTLGARQTAPPFRGAGYARPPLTNRHETSLPLQRFMESVHDAEGEGDALHELRTTTSTTLQNFPSLVDGHVEQTVST